MQAVLTVIGTIAAVATVLPIMLITTTYLVLLLASIVTRGRLRRRVRQAMKDLERFTMILRPDTRSPRPLASAPARRRS